MSETNQYRLPSNLTGAELKTAVTNLIEFYDFSFFSERDISVSHGLTYGVEMLAVSMGLVGEHLNENSDYSTPEMIEDFVIRMDQWVTNSSEHSIQSAWKKFRGSLPYSHGLHAAKENK